MSKLIGLFCAALVLAGCASKPKFDVVLNDLMTGASPDKIVLILEDTENLPRRSARDSTGAATTQVNLAKGRVDRKVLQFAERLNDGGVGKAGFAGERTPYQVVAAIPPFDYAVTFFYRNDGVYLENLCFYQRAIVFRLKPGFINYIPKNWQPPLSNGKTPPAGGPTTLPADLKGLLAKFPISSMEAVIPDPVAVVQFGPDGLAQAFGGEECRFSEDFKVVTRFDTPGASPQ